MTTDVLWTLINFLPLTYCDIKPLRDVLENMLSTTLISSPGIRQHPSSWKPCRNTLEAASVSSPANDEVGIAFGAIDRGE